MVVTVEIKEVNEVHYRDGFHFNGEHKHVAVNFRYFLNTWIMRKNTKVRVAISTARKYKHHIVCNYLFSNDYMARFYVHNPVNNYTYNFSVCKSEFEDITGLAMVMDTKYYYKIL